MSPVRPGRPAAATEAGERSAGAAAGRGAALLAVGLIIGIVLLNRFDDGPSGELAAGGGPDPAPVVTTTLPTGTTAPPTTVALRARKDVKVLVANASGIDKVATKVRDLLTPLGYTLLTPQTSSTKSDASIIYFAPTYEPEARQLARDLNLPETTVKALPTPAPVPNLQAANILLLAGKNDLAARVNTTTTTARGATTTTARGATTTRNTATTTTTR